MMQSLRGEPTPLWKKCVRIAIPVLSVVLIGILFRGIVSDALILVFGASAVAFLLEPLARLLEKKLSRPLAALVALLGVLGVLVGALLLLLPSLIREAIALAQELPGSVEMVKGWLASASAWLESHIPGIELPAPALGSPELPAIASGTLNFAGGVADWFYQFSLMIVLGYFFLCDRTRLMLRLELLVPQSMRKTAVRMGNAVCRELRLYIRGQGLIALAVGALAAVGLWLVGVQSALVLGIIVGILNMIPYFGPVLGGIPAVLMALGSGWQTALMAVAVLWLVQQLDGSFISPRILGNLTGLSPAVVLLAIFVGSGVAGIPGMLLALPLLMTFRTVFRVFVQRHENV